MDAPSAQPGVPQLSRARTSRLAASGLSLIAVCYGLARFAYGLYLPAFRRDFELSATAAGAIGAGSYAAYCVAIMAATAATARWGSRVVAVTAGAVATAGTGLVAAAPTTPVLAIGVVVAGTSTGLASPPLAEAVARRVRTDRRDRVQTIINAGTGVGVAVSGPLALAAGGHWRLGWALAAVLCAGVTGWVAKTVPHSQLGQVGPRGGFLPRPLRPAGADRLLLAGLTMGAASTAIWTFGRDLLTTAGGMSTAMTSLCWVLLGVFGIIAVGVGDLVNRIGLGRSWLAGILGVAVATALVAVLPANLPVAVVSFALFGATYIGLTSVVLVWGTRVYSHSPVLGVGLAFLLIAVGQAATTPVLGALIDSVGGQWAFVLAIVIALVGTGLRPAPATRLPRAGQ